MGGFKEIASQKNIIFLRNSTRDSQLKSDITSKEKFKRFCCNNISKNRPCCNPTLLQLIEQEISIADLLGRIGGDFGKNSRIIDDFLLENGDQQL